jgi:hypothetical protein
VTSDQSKVGFPVSTVDPLLGEYNVGAGTGASAGWMLNTDDAIMLINSNIKTVPATAFPVKLPILSLSKLHHQ